MSKVLFLFFPYKNVVSKDRFTPCNNNIIFALEFYGIKNDRLIKKHIIHVFTFIFYICELRSKHDVLNIYVNGLSFVFYVSFSEDERILTNTNSFIKRFCIRTAAVQ